MNPRIQERYRLLGWQHNQGGFSLLEVLMALVVVFLALLGFAGFSVVAHTGMTASEKMTRAVTLAQEKLEDVRRDGVSTSLIGTWVNTEPYGSITSARHHQRTLTIQPHTPTPGLHTVTVEVKWDQDAHTTSLKTYLTN
jgi:prepilin-type N-terminal cleavage/methylation domain-containing protein